MGDKILAENTEGFRWTKSLTLLFVSLIKENYIQLQIGKKKLTYQKIANQINARVGTHLSYDQIESKWKGMKLTYNKVKNSNANLRQGRKCWEFYHVIDDILSTTPAITPQSTMSTEDLTTTTNYGLKFSYIDCNEIATTSPRPNKRRKRHYSYSVAAEDAKERRHQEKMKLAKRFLDIFQKMVDKM